MIAVCDLGPLRYLVPIDCDHVLPHILESSLPYSEAAVMWRELARL